VLEKLTGSAFDRDFVYLPEQGIPSAGNTVTGNTVSWVAAVPNGSKNLDLAVTARFTPGVSLVALPRERRCTDEYLTEVIGQLAVRVQEARCRLYCGLSRHSTHSSL